MGAWTRPQEFRSGDWLTTCAFHPFTFWSSETYIDSMGRVRCRRFCNGRENERDRDMKIAAAHHLREAPAPPFTRPRHGGMNAFARPYARWPMQRQPLLLESEEGHDGVPAPFAATVVPGPRGPVFRFDGTQGYMIQQSTGANPQIDVPGPDNKVGGYAMAAWVKVAGFPPSDGSAIFGKVGGIFDSGMALVVAKPDVALLVYASVGGPIFGFYAVPGGIIGKWIHIASDWDGTTVTLYINGVSVLSGVVPTLVPSTAPLRVGNSDFPDVPLIGDLFDVRYFLRPFETGELAQVMGPPIP